ncbi:SIS domain-containing protein [Catenovulum sp. SM1970]|uniref:glucosamine-6-phosphate deaminase NagB-II n=1 Tax=Marinifaba aquimaris TaxID=2741323 RepID=UPI001571D540|nr:SIS domain-containing protein [Marinifaba aquimaris]NTS76615.1 SIS domain-containing protein [Marinifaba aquimaris]
MSEPLISLEAKEAPKRIAEQLEENDHATDKLGSHLKLMKPRYIYIVGRGSSDHAGTFAKYLFEIETGIPVASAAPSVTSIYGKKLNLDKALVLVISQSGRSPDILAQAEMAKQSGAFVVALVNDENSPLCDITDAVLPLKAGEQNAIGATKSLLTTLSALLQFAAKWSSNKELRRSIYDLPELLEQSIKAPSIIQPELLTDVKDCAILGRGFGYAVAREVAIKLVGLCGIHAEPFSSAEFLHGGVSLIEQNITVLNTLIQDESFKSHMAQVRQFEQRGVSLHHIKQPFKKIPPRFAPLTVLQRFYLDLPEIAKARGIDPDNPPGIQKITRTL